MGTKEVAMFLGKDLRTIKYYGAKGYLRPTHKENGLNVYDKKEVIDFVINPPNPRIKFGLGSDAKELAKRMELVIRESKNFEKNKDKYVRKRFLEVYSGYDFLQHLGLVRRYICGKYRILNYQLELILYLYPLNYFTHSDIARFPKHYTFRTINALIKKKVIVVVSKAHKKKKYDKDVRKNTLYALTKEMRQAVEEFYELLSKERPFEEGSKAFELTQSSGRHNERLIKMLNKKPAPEKFKRLYTN